MTGLTESSKCPECGRPLVEVLTRSPQWKQTGRRFESSIRVFGLPLVHVALGPSGNELRGRAKGIIAIGDISTGVLAIGGMARGVIAIGGLAVGLVAFGGLGIGLIAALGGGAIGGLAMGGGACGIVAQGGGAVGILADGGGAYGYIARGGGAWGHHVISGAGASPEAQQAIGPWLWLIGDRPPSYRMALWALAAWAGVATISALIVMVGYLLGRGQSEDQRGRFPLG